MVRSGGTYSPEQRSLVQPGHCDRARERGGQSWGHVDVRQLVKPKQN